MKKKLLIVGILIVGLLVSVYFYAYKEHRNIATAQADFALTVSALQKEFAENDSLATVKYQNKVIQIQGVVTNVDVKSKSLVIDDKVYAQFDTNLPSGVEAREKITIKGRFLAYDDLVEEFKMDQTSVIE